MSFILSREKFSHPAMKEIIMKGTKYVFVNECETLRRNVKHRCPGSVIAKEMENYL